VNKAKTSKIAVEAVVVAAAKRRAYSALSWFWSAHITAWI